ncbi:class I SAM-dependent methyltransferase [Candidatus Nitrosocosmicus arcticus]|uniref:Methylase involved in ubiquinone/menaquinone biosynthesis n=1 Tax=Candidatus Nitrosocosmicus arcticus TaxID=2035267 RepID=A0A557SXE4_9ARCH|nr:methyltransferase domain-containing protein [Candidatus Nitrosocosmicus arcticus]TVP41275.1 Methylase involved in ubiquinone/menaquinone biosynthesis [Candidatus Nitrosocosmicus arcticus]
MNDNRNEVKEIWSRGDYRSRGQFFPPVSARLTRLVNLQANDSVLDVACGYGNTAITARRVGAKVTGIDITPKLLALAKGEEKIAGISGIDWKEGDAEDLPFEDESFDVILSTFGHIFAPNQELAGKEMVRVLKKGGRLAFTSWPPELAVGKLSEVVSMYNPLTSEAFSPDNWGIPDKIKQLLPYIKDIYFEKDTINIPILSPNHYWQDTITKAGFMIQVIEALKKQNDEEKIESFRKDYIKTLEPFISYNVLRLGYLITIASK